VYGITEPFELELTNFEKGKFKVEEDKFDYEFSLGKKVWIER